MDDKMRIKAGFIDEKHNDRCIACRKRKSGRLLMINLPYNKYLVICTSCLTKKTKKPEALAEFSSNIANEI
jgi:hypothetical protein